MLQLKLIDFERAPRKRVSRKASEVRILLSPVFFNLLKEYAMPKRIISCHYVLTKKTGDKLDSSENRGPLLFMEGSGQIIPGLEKELVLLKQGDKKKIEVSAAEAYGTRRLELIIKIPRAKLPAAEIKVGDRFRGGEDHDSPIFTVTAVNELEATLDANHPLAGEDLTFQVEMADIREATAEELEHGHAHGDGGHSH